MMTRKELCAPATRGISKERESQCAARKQRPAQTTAFGGPGPCPFIRKDGETRHLLELGMDLVGGCSQCKTLFSA